MKTSRRKFLKSLALMCAAPHLVKNMPMPLPPPAPSCFAMGASLYDMELMLPIIEILRSRRVVCGMSTIEMAYGDVVIPRQNTAPLAACNQ